MKKYIQVLSLAIILTTAGGCRSGKASLQTEAEPVVAVKVLKADLPWKIEYPAQVAGSLQVQVRAQVDGILKARLFDEGSYVKEGTALFLIDPKEYEVALQRAEGALSQAQTDLNRTRRDYERMEKLRKDNAVSQKDYDDALSAYEAAQAAVQVARAGVNTAKINLQYTQVLAPISGITGKEAQSVGSLVSPTGNGLLTTMVQIHPLWVNFSMPGSQFYQLANGYLDGTIKLVAQGEVPIYVEAIMPNGQVYPERGEIVFFDSSEDSRTSSLAMRAQFPNPKNQRMLMPGQFVRVRLIGAVYKDALLIPSSAVLSTPTGNLVYVVGTDGKVSARPVTVQLQDNLYIVSKGLSEGETVISEGLLKIRPDMKVVAQVQPFQLPESALPIVPSTATAADIESFDAVIQRAESPDKQVLPGVTQSGRQVK